MNGWKRIPRGQPCPVCGHADGWCTVAPDGTGVNCKRMSSPHPIKQVDGVTGYYHRMPGEPSAAIRSLSASPKQPAVSTKQWEAVMKNYRSAMSDRILRATAKELGVREDDLLAFDVGLDIGAEWWKGTGDPCFPMYDGRRQIIGIRTRTPDRFLTGKHRRRYGCVAGSHNGLFIPKDYDPAPVPHGLAAIGRDDGDTYPTVLLLPEGPTSSMAARRLGFASVGRPNNSGGSEMICTLLKAHCRQDVVIVSDRDLSYLSDGRPQWPGWEGALALAKCVIKFCGKLRIIQPPVGKDLRKWLQNGGTTAELIDTIRQTKPIDLSWIASEENKTKAWKIRLHKAKAG